MFINEKYLNYFNNDNVNIFVIENYIENIIDKILFVISVFDNVLNKFK